MRFVALASDYDGTLAQHGIVNEDTLQTLQNFRQSGRKLILVSGRVLADLETVFERCDLFDRIVAENGAVLYTPATREKQVLAPPPNQQLLLELEKRGVQNIGMGDAIVSTWHPHETAVLEVIRDLGLELQVVFNKGAVMVLPSGVNKKSGLEAALNSLSLSSHNVIGVGDAENDHAFLDYCECSVAVANALDSVKEKADIITKGSRGAGVVELVQMVLTGEMKTAGRRAIPLGAEDDHEITIPPVGSSLLLSGASGAGKSTFVAGWLEVLMERNYQFCLIDPEGDYEAFPNTIAAGDEKHPPSIDQFMQTLQNPATQVIANLMAVKVADRPHFFNELLPRLLEMRARTGRPHWIVVDEAHHMLPPDWTLPAVELTGALENIALITVHPDHLAPAALQAVDTVLAIGHAPEKVFEAFAIATGTAPAPLEPTELHPGEMLAWFPRTGRTHRLRMRLSHTERLRHKRNYSSGELGEDNSFYFRGPKHALNLRAQNLTLFLQLADGVDDETWNYHLRRSDYSRWFREAIKDEKLAEEVEQFERQESLNPRESREKIRDAVERRYTAPV